MMNRTQRTIVLVGNATNLQVALEAIKGFKACICIKQVNPEIIENTYSHNKNVVYGTSVNKISPELMQHNPVIVKIVKGTSNFENMELGLRKILIDFPVLMDKHGIDVGDHAKDDSAGVKSNKSSCMICRSLAGTGVRKEHILYESKNFFAMPGLGAFFDGYVMICPKKHIMSFAECEEEEFEEFLQVLDDMKYILKSVYNKDIFVFECGSGKNGGGKHATSIVHAHIHLAPTDMPVLKCIKDSGIYPALISPEQLNEYGQYPYMLYIDQEDNWYMASDPQSYYPRQHPRQVLADYMGLKKGEYNWRTHPHEHMLDSIAEDIYSFYRENFDNLPSWIQGNVKKFIQ